VQARRVFPLLVAALALTSVAVAASYRTYTVPAASVSFQLPASWKVIDAKHVLTAAQIASLSKDNPELSGSLSQVNKPNSAVKFFGFDPAIAGGFATNVNVVSVGIGQTIDFATYAQALQREISSLSSVSNLSATRVKLPGGEAVRLSYNLRFVSHGTVGHTATLQYGFLRNGNRSVVFTYTTLPAEASAYAGVFATSARSIRFG
jgi:hypothetical protein